MKPKLHYKLIKHRKGPHEACNSQFWTKFFCPSAHHANCESNPLAVTCRHCISKLIRLGLFKDVNGMGA